MILEQHAEEAQHDTEMDDDPGDWVCVGSDAPTIIKNINRMFTAGIEKLQRELDDDGVPAQVIAAYIAHLTARHRAHWEGREAVIERNLAISRGELPQ